MHLFYSPDLIEGINTLPEEEAHHAYHVLRVRTGDRIGLLDGRGGRAEAEVIEAGKKGVLVKAGPIDRAPENGTTIHLAVAITKTSDRFEWFLEKAVELGMNRLTPLITERVERDRMRIDRLQKIAIAAMKQSQRRYLPVIDTLTRLKDLPDHAEQRFFGWCEGDHPSLMQLYTTASSAIVVIGPEGDLSPAEAQQLMDQGFRPIGLGKARLRTETAALAACTWMSLMQQR
jgi:16S rRNA (uracil1498-N3)-methyltransferase